MELMPSVFPPHLLRFSVLLAPLLSVLLFSLPCSSTSYIMIIAWAASAVLSLLSSSEIDADASSSAFWAAASAASANSLAWRASSSLRLREPRDVCVVGSSEMMRKCSTMTSSTFARAGIVGMEYAGPGSLKLRHSCVTVRFHDTCLTAATAAAVTGSRYGDNAVTDIDFRS